MGAGWGLGMVGGGLIGVALLSLMILSLHQNSSCEIFILFLSPRFEVPAHTFFPKLYLAKLDDMACLTCCLQHTAT